MFHKRKDDLAALSVKEEMLEENPVDNSPAATTNSMFNATAVMDKIGQYEHHLPGLPSSFERYFDTMKTADPTMYLVLAAAILLGLVLVVIRQIKALFSRPPPVPTKRLPMRPALSIQFKPDDISASTMMNNSDAQTVMSAVTAAATTTYQETAASSRHGRGKTTASSPFPKSTSAILRSSFETGSTNMNERDHITETV